MKKIQLNSLKYENEPLLKPIEVDCLKAESIDWSLNTKIYVKIDGKLSKRKVYRDCIGDCYIIVRKQRFYEHEFEM